MSPRIVRRRREPPPFLLLGRVLRPHGVRGELRVEIITAYPERIVENRRVFLGTDPADAHAATEHRVRRARRHQQYLILELEGLADRTTADAYRDQYVMVPLKKRSRLRKASSICSRPWGWTWSPTRASTWAKSPM